MLLRETGFSFGGVHSRDDMGLIYAEKDGHIMIPEIRRNAYQIAGMSGTVLMPGEAWQPFNLEGTLYPAEEPRTQAEAQELLRNVSEWLTVGRQRLIFDYEPGKFYDAELSAQSKWSLRNWFGGELQIRFLAQPFAWNVEEATGTRDISASGSVGVGISVETGLPTPLKITVENTGGSAISEVSIGGDIAFMGLPLSPGQTLTIDTAPPAGAMIGSVNALPCATRFRPILLNNGMNTRSVVINRGSARVTFRTRGRW